MSSIESDTTKLKAIAIIERVCSVFSLMGCVFIIASFFLSKAFHKPINRLVFYASFGNMMANVGTLMSRSYVGTPASAGCQFQGFLIQMFMPADAFWTLAMAINVYLTFYWKFDAARLRKMEVSYLIFCYGIPFVPALTYVFINQAPNGRFYGDATLWCWVTKEWDVFRIATFYGPIWIVILVTCFIYIRAGREIYHKRKQLRNFSLPDPEPMPIIHDPFSSVKTTEVLVTTEVASRTTNNASNTNNTNNIDLAPIGGRRLRSPKPATTAPDPVYSVTISTSKNRRESYADEAGLTGPSNSSTRNVNNPLRHRAAFEANNAAWSYTKCSILFFTAMLITWIPSSANRVFSVVHGGEADVLEYMSAFVLPLQGFWNAVIYIVTSWRACQIMWEDMLNWVDARRGGTRRDVTELVGYDTSSRSSAGKSSHSRINSNKAYESESMTELASRPTSDGQANMRS
ncbi:G-protein coupled receptor [Zalerion maritima]|uniref:G-protein coupled receptor n=1 Tax=Zalerion maritima TaxID=339359 RepID=A0AAD5RR22_9PEZI|nr:G-protein coupled receptor [Zalerion maritima]